MISDQFRFRKHHQKLNHIKDAKQREEQLIRLEEKISTSIQKRALRATNKPKITYPDLPIVAEKDQIIKAIQENQVVIVAGETGSGKTTQLPKICIEAGLGVAGLIGHTQPRRIAARTIATHIASEFESALGFIVGYKVRFADVTKPSCYIKIMTDGILLTETQNDRWLQQYDCIIIDEAHERSLNIDFLLGYIKNLLTKRKDLKVIITSATIDIERFSKFFHDAPIIEVKGRIYPVELNYLGKDFHVESDDPVMQVLQAVELACKRGQGDILIFQSGEKEILEVIEVLEKHRLSNTMLLPLYARQSVSDQQKVFQTFGKRKIIVTTNVAETSLTVPNIRFVIDSGVARISRYNYRNKLQRLPIEAISQASADQRKGRCGRVGPGICYRLYTEDDFLTRTFFTEPEILRTNLAGVILKMLSLNFKEIQSFDFIDPPDSRFIKDGFTLLERLQAVNENRQITPLGRLMANIPIEPKLARIIIAAKEFGALKELLIIVSALSIIDVRERPHDCQEQADVAHAKFIHENSDFMSYLLLWHFIFEHKESLSHQKFRKLCKENFLSYLRVCEWLDVYEQLRIIVNELGFKINQVDADYSLIHKSLLCGFIDTIGVKEDKKEYCGARNVKFFIHPGSSLFKKAPSWMMSCEIVHTTKTYARTNAQIETKWIEEVAQPLLKKQHYEPYFEPKQGHVMAFEKATLFGLEIYTNRKVNYEKYSPLLARKIFIEQALVQGQIKTSCSFFHKNIAIQKQLEVLENRIRRQQILYDENMVYQFYEKHLPLHICSTQSLEKYYFDKSDNELVFTQSDIAIVDINQDIIAGFPEKIIIKGLEFNLEYHFDLSENNDGVTLLLTLDTLKYVKDEDLSRLIPGLIEDKITFLMKAMPKRIRSLFTPLPEYVQRAKKYIETEEGSLTQLLLKFLQKQTHGDVPENIWDDVTLPAYLIMHAKVVDEHGKTLAFGDNLQQLYSDLKDVFPDVLSNKHPVENENFTHWDFKDLLEIQKTRKNNLDFIYYPAIVDNINCVNIRLFDESSIAKYNHHFGLTRLYLLQMHEACRNFKKNISTQKKTIAKLYASMGDYESFIEDILFATAENVFVLENEDIRAKEQFLQTLAKRRSQFLLTAMQIFKIAFDALTQYNQISLRCLKFQEKSPEIVAIKDIENQLTHLFTKHFIKSTPLIWLKRYPLYLKAIEQRIDKLPRQLDKDKQVRQEIEIVRKVYSSKLATKDISHLLPNDPLLNFRWKIEELRISYFAQELKTIEPVSKIRLLKVLEQLL
jgi:ATP-dependent helicase HrpA